LDGRIKPALLIIAAATGSLTCLSLPTVRTVVAALPDLRSKPISCSGLREMASCTHAQFGAIAAEVACTYIRKFSASQDAVLPAEGSRDRDQGSGSSSAGSCFREAKTKCELLPILLLRSGLL